METIIRKAKISDIGTIFELVNDFAKQGLMLPKSQIDLYESIRDFFVIEIDNKVVACGALKVFLDDLAEIRSLATNKDFQKMGLGKMITQKLLDDAKELGIKKVFTLSYQVDFFKKQGFTLIKKEELPQKIWRDCYKCPKFPNCDENALIIEI
mgnify:CR=1 FL=1